MATTQKTTKSPSSSAPVSSGVLQRKCACGAKTSGSATCSKCGSDEHKKKQLQRKATHGGELTEVPEVVHEVLRSPGQSLDPATRAFMEPRFGHDFSQVRVHTDTTAARSAQAVDALAYTVGSHVVFGAGRFSPTTASGKNLLAHELTHVTQQSSQLATRSLQIGAPDDEFERAADATAQAVMEMPARSLAESQPIRTGSQFRTAPSIARGAIVNPRPAAKLRRKVDEEGAANDASRVDVEAGARGAASNPQSECPAVPTGRSEVIPEPPCPVATHRGELELARFQFCLDSDEPVRDSDLRQLEAIVKSRPRGTRFLVHGYASKDGKQANNVRLSCHRANRIATELGLVLAVEIDKALQSKFPNPEDRKKRVAAELDNRIEVAAQGPTDEFAGGAAANRVAVVYGQIPGGEAPEEPGCEDAPRHIGDITPEVPCDPATMDLTQENGSPQLRHFHFCLDSDVLAATSATNIRSFAQSQAATTTFVVHGFSSSEGKADSNQRLSCHRALRIYRELINAGVPSTQIREVSGNGATTAFAGGPEFNRVAVVLAEGGKIGAIQDGKRPADTPQQKQAILSAALQRLMSGQYALAADAYMSFWTCGRTATVRQALERLVVLLPRGQDDELIRSEANGTEEGIGVNTVRISNVALRADNPIECTMGRLIDMAFHQAVVDDPDLNFSTAEAAAKNDPTRAPRAERDERHFAGRHLIHLAGLEACEGAHATAKPGSARGPSGIDKPLTGDPRAGKSPVCASAPQPTRLLPPAPGTRDRQAPEIRVDQFAVQPNDGELRSRLVSEQANGTHLVATTGSDVITASADVTLVGKPETFADYEVGFIQSIIDDLTLAEYVTGHIMVQRLPVPIRAAHLKGAAPVPEPWMALQAVARPTSDGTASLNAGWQLQTETALTLNLFGLPSDAPKNLLDTWQRHTTVAIWLVARRRGAPLDRFSVLFRQGQIYEVTQNLDLENRRIRGDLMADDASFPGEMEKIAGVGRFRTAETSTNAADPQLARFGNPVSSDIDLIRQAEIKKLLLPQATTEESGMDLAEYQEVVQKIIDGLKLFDTEAEANQGKGSKDDPRLGFAFTPLNIRIVVDRRTGRVLPFLRSGSGEVPIHVTGPGLGERAGFHLAKALGLRLQKRDFLQQGRSVALRPSAIPGSPSQPFGEISLSLPALKDDRVPERDLSQEQVVLDDLAEMWACSELTLFPNSLQSREFGKVWWRDRDQKVNGLPSNGPQMGDADDGSGVISVNLPCGPEHHPAGYTVGSAHTHVNDEDPNVQLPSVKDIAIAKAGGCGRQHFIVSKDHVEVYFSDGSIRDLGPRTSVLKNVKCPIAVPTDE